MKRYKFWNQSWNYIVVVDDNDIVIESSKNPNGRPHWTIGCTLDELKEYYISIRSIPKTEVDALLKVHMELIDSDNNYDKIRYYKDSISHW